MVIKSRRVAATAVLALAVGMAGAASAGAERASSFHGVFGETPAGSAAGYDIHGSVKMTISSAGTTVRVNVSGLDPDKVYGSHLHNGTCASGGGGHYQDIEGGATVPPNELWLSTNGAGLVPNPGGVAHGAGSATWMARVSSASTNARSVVVHEPGSGARIGCADLQ
ncbi:hypothetical protein BH24ACT5_BH24ACT5_03340 [soil metagenome]